MTSDEVMTEVDRHPLLGTGRGLVEHGPSVGVREWVGKHSEAA